VAVFALSAMAASAAQAVTAPYFTIGGTRLIAGQTHNFDAKAFNAEGFTLTSGVIKITCTNLSIREGVLLGSNAGQPGKDDEIAVFSNCTVAGNGTGCTVAEPIVTNPLTSELVENEKNKNQLLEEFKPVTPPTFVTLLLSANCTASGQVAVTGSVAAELLTDPGEATIELGQAAKEAGSWLVKFPTTTIKEVLLINSSGSFETVKMKLESFGVESSLKGTALSLLANTKFEGERNALWSPLP